MQRQLAKKKRGMLGLPGRMLRRLLGSQSGSTATMFALSLPAIMAAVGVGSDFAIYNMKYEKLQAAADDAALAGAKEFSVATSSSKSISDAASNFALSGYAGSSSVAVTTSVDSSKKTVTVNLNETWSPFFAHFLGASVTPVVAHATASAAGRGNICVLLLDPGASKTGDLSSNSKVTANGCDFYSNSAAADGINVGNSAVITADSTCSVGGVSNAGTITPAATTDCPVIDDPLASRPAPTFGGCTFSNLKINNLPMIMVPGVYCGGLSITGSSDVTFAPGTYIIKDGEFKISDTAKIQGTHVGFYLTGAASVVNFIGSTTVNLSGANAGAMSGLLFFEDRAAPIGRQHRINSNNAAVLTGTIYLPRGNLLVDPGSKVAASSAYTSIITQKLLLKPGPELVLNSNYGGTDVPVPDGIKATARVVLLK